MARGRLQVDADDRRVVWRPSPAMLWLRGAVFVILGIGLPALTLGDGASGFVTVPVLLVTAATAAWFVAGLRQGWELDEGGLQTDVARRRSRRLGWDRVDGLEIVADDLVVVMRGGRRVPIGSAEPGLLHDAIATARSLGIVPAHVTLPADEACGS